MSISGALSSARTRSTFFCFLCFEMSSVCKTTIRTAYTIWSPRNTILSTANFSVYVFLLRYCFTQTVSAKPHSCLSVLHLFLSGVHVLTSRPSKWPSRNCRTQVEILMQTNVYTSSKPMTTCHWNFKMNSCKLVSYWTRKGSIT